MAFPFSYTRTRAVWQIPESNAFQEELFEQFAEKLDRAHIKQTERSQNCLRFWGAPFRFAWNGWNMLNPVSKGELVFEESPEKIKLKYTLFFHEFLAIALAFSIIPLTVFFFPELKVQGAFGFLTNIGLGIALLLLIWGIAFGGSYALVVFRFNRYFKKLFKQTYLKHKPNIVNPA